MRSIPGVQDHHPELLCVCVLLGLHLHFACVTAYAGCPSEEEMEGIRESEEGGFGILTVLIPYALQQALGVYSEFICQQTASQRARQGEGQGYR